MDKISPTNYVVDELFDRIFVIQAYVMMMASLMVSTPSQHTVRALKVLSRGPLLDDTVISMIYMSN